MRISSMNQVCFVCILSAYLLITCFIFQNFQEAIAIAITIQVLCVNLASAKTSDRLFALIYGYRRIFTNQEKERLLPVFNDVIELYENRCQVKSKIEIYIDDSIMINAFAIGTRSVVITRGALHTLSDEQLKAVISHEVGHIFNGDTLISSILLIGNVFSFVFLMIIKLFECIINAISYVISGREKEKKGFIANALVSIVFTLYMLGTLIIQLVVAIHNRRTEYEADRFAYSMDLGDSLTSALYFLSNTDLREKSPSITERLKATHPNIFYRIARLEHMLENEEMVSIRL